MKHMQQYKCVKFRKNLTVVVRRFYLTLKKVQISTFLIIIQIFSLFESEDQKFLTLHKSDHFCESGRDEWGWMPPGMVGTGWFCSGHIIY